MTRVEVRAQMLRRERGEKQPTRKQPEGFAKVTQSPFGYLLLPELPLNRVPISSESRMGSSSRAKHLPRGL